MNGLNKENKFPNLTKWCEYYHKESGLKVHPSSVPVDVVLDELLGHVMAIHRRIEMITSTLELITARFEETDLSIKEALVAIVELESKTGHMTFKTADEVQEEWKENNKPVTKKVKK